MLNYDVIVIGGGIAGYTAGLKCLEKGLKTAVISSGKSAFHFSSGSIDVLSHSPVTNEAVEFPLETIQSLKTELPQHPYARVGVERVKEALNWFQSMMTEVGLPLSHSDNNANHFRITPMGTLKPTWMSQANVKQVDYQFKSLANVKRIVMVSIEGFRDFQPQIAQDNIQRHSAFKDIPVITANVNIAALGSLSRNPHELRSIDVGRILSDETQFKAFADQLVDVANSEDLVIMPAILGNGDGLQIMQRLKEYTKLNFHEVPTMPPSMLGIRIEDTLMRSFIKKGGMTHRNDEVQSGDFELRDDNLSLTALHTRNMGDMPLKAKQFIFATGSFFSKGLVAEQNNIVEPVLKLDMADIGDRTSWYQPEFFTKNPHAFLSFGVKTDVKLRPSIKGKNVSNLYCAGSLLADYNPVSHGCGSGVAISTAYYAVESLSQKLLEEKVVEEASV